MGEKRRGGTLKRKDHVCLLGRELLDTKGSDGERTVCGTKAELKIESLIGLNCTDLTFWSSLKIGSEGALRILEYEVSV